MDTRIHTINNENVLHYSSIRLAGMQSKNVVDSISQLSTDVNDVFCLKKKKEGEKKISETDK
jgi:hypothetical protein